MMARSPCEPVAMMLLVRRSTENRTGTSVVSPSAPAKGAGHRARAGGSRKQQRVEHLHQARGVAVDDAEDLDLRRRRRACRAA